jgi:glycosyltransferase involved in cell wall biosynthesis
VSTCASSKRFTRKSLALRLPKRAIHNASRVSTEVYVDILSIAVHYGLSKPPGGGQNRYAHIIQELKTRGNNVIVLEPDVFFDVGDRERAKIYTYPRYAVFGRTLNLLKDIDIWFVARLISIFRSEHIDLIAIDSPYGALAVRLAAKLTRNDAPLIYSSHNVEASFTHEVTPQFDQLSRFERKLIPLYVTALESLTTKHLATHVTAVSDEDRRLFCRKYGLNADKITMIPSGCQLEAPLDKQAKKRLKEDMGLDPDAVIVVFHGAYSFPPNRDAIDVITNYVAPKFERDASVLFVLYGTDVPKFERANVRSFGFVEDLHKALSVADIALVPLRSGSGTKLKLFDYMNAGLPIIATRKGVEGVRAYDKDYAIVVDDIHAEMIDSISYLVNNPQERERLGLNSRRLAENEYGWGPIGDKLESTYRMLAKRHAHS